MNLQTPAKYVAHAIILILKLLDKYVIRSVLRSL